MSEYLRDFINDNVGEECGGVGDLTNPTTIQMRVNECLMRLDKLEAGIGFTVKIQDKVNLAFTNVDNKFVSIVPSEGTLTLASTLSDKAGDFDGLESLTITIYKNSGTITTNTYSINHKNKVNTAVTGILVYTNDLVEISATPYSYIQGGSGGGSITPEGRTSSETESGGTIIVSDTKLLACSAVIQLPTKTYGVENAGS